VNSLPHRSLPVGLRAARLALCATLALAALLRGLAARGDLWLDEVWTLGLLAQIHSVIEIATRLHHDNNHLLNSLALWLLRPFDSAFVYRLPAVIAGSLVPALGAWIAARGEVAGADASDAPVPVRALFAAVLLGGSFLLVQYGSEARGYAYAEALALLALAAACRGGLAPRSPWAWLYAGAASLGVLAHASGVHAIAGGLAWSAWRWGRQRLRPAEFARAFARWHALPALTAIAFYFGFLRHATTGGGYRREFWPMLGDLAAYTLGLPRATDPLWPVAAAAALLALGAWQLVRARSDALAFYAVAVLVSPAITTPFGPTGRLYERYYAVNATFGLLLCARGLAGLSARGPLCAALAAALLLGLTAGSAPRIARLLDEQRGHYHEALIAIAREQPEGEILVASDQDFRNGMMIAYEVGRDPALSRIHYLNTAAAARRAPDWYVAHRFEGEPAPPPTGEDRLGRRYRLVHAYPSGPLSGFRWYWFRVEDPDAGTSASPRAERAAPPVPLR